MKNFIKLFLVSIIVLSCIFVLSACETTPDQIEKPQENTSSPISAWQDYYGNLYVEIENTADTQTEASWNGNEENWCYYMENELILASYSDIEEYIGEEISIYSRICERYNEDSSIKYLPSEKSTSLKYMVKEAWDTNSSEYSHFVHISQSWDGQSEDIINPPQTGTIAGIDVSYWLISTDETEVSSAIWYFSDENKDKIFIKKLTCDNKNYTLSENILDYEYKFLSTDAWNTYNKTEGISVGNRESIIVRIAETAEKCCSEDFIIALITDFS